MADRPEEQVSAEDYVDKVILDGRFLDECGRDPEGVAARLGVALAPGALDRIRAEGVGNLVKRPSPYGVVSRLASWITFADGWQGPPRDSRAGDSDPQSD